MTTATKTKKIAKWIVEGAVERVRAGETTIEALNPELAAAVAKVIGAKPAGVILPCRIVRESDKAWLLEISRGQQLATVECWMPKSQARVADGMVSVPGWLAAEKGLN